MAKVIITLEDEPDGGISLAVDFNPPPVKGQPLTAAQSTGMAFVEGATELKDNPT